MLMTLTSLVHFLNINYLLLSLKIFFVLVKYSLGVMLWGPYVVNTPMTLRTSVALIRSKSVKDSSKMDSLYILAPVLSRIKHCCIIIDYCK